MAALFQDLKYGVRLLVRHRGFTVVAALVLALGIGANTAVFTLINSLLLKPRPGVPDAELAGVYSRDRTKVDSYRAFSYPNYADLRERKDCLCRSPRIIFRWSARDSDNTRIFIDVITSILRHVRRAARTRPRSRSTKNARADIPVAILSYGMWQRLGGTDGCSVRQSD
jgi:putative ABC transport system permease protein